MAAHSSRRERTVVSVSYKGQVFRIPLGTRGMMPDEVQTRVPFDALLEARNITYVNGLLEKEPGSIRWNASALGNSIVALSDFWPDDVTQRVCALTADGVLHKFIDLKQSVVLGPETAVDTQAIILATNKPPCFVTGGAENGDNRKLFLFTGTTQVQVIDGNATARRDMTKPALDWADGSFPTAGCIHAGKLAAWGNKNFPHQLYLSNSIDHEDFQTAGAVTFFPVFPGEGERILGCYNYKGRLFIFKFPYGVYYLDDSDPSVTNWSIHKLSGVFGAASAFSFVEGLDDLYVANAQGSVTQMSATLNFGSMQTGNIMRNLRNESYMRSHTARFGYLKRYGLWYEDKKIAYFTYQSSGGIHNDLMLVIDFNDPATPKISWSDKDQPNCLTLVKDPLGIPRPFYGSSDGYIYRMDRPTWDVAGQAYTGEFKTVNLDFGSADPGLAEREKIYDFLEVTFEEAGEWDLSIDVYIDNYFSETLSVLMTKKEYLSNFPLGPTGLNQALGRAPQSYRVPLHGKGRRIAFKCYNSGLYQDFRISELGIYFRPAGQAQEG